MNLSCRRDFNAEKGVKKHERVRFGSIWAKVYRDWFIQVVRLRIAKQYLSDICSNTIWLMRSAYNYNNLDIL